MFNLFNNKPDYIINLNKVFSYIKIKNTKSYYKDELKEEINVLRKQFNVQDYSYNDSPEYDIALKEIYSRNLIWTKKFNIYEIKYISWETIKIDTLTYNIKFIKTNGI